MIIQYFFLILLSSTIFNVSAMDQSITGLQIELQQLSERKTLWSSIITNNPLVLLTTVIANDTQYKNNPTSDTENMEKQAWANIVTKAREYQTQEYNTIYNDLYAWSIQVNSLASNIVKLQNLRIAEISQETKKKHPTTEQSYPAYLATVKKNYEKEKAEKALERPKSPLHRFTKKKASIRPPIRRKTI